MKYPSTSKSATYPYEHTIAQAAILNSDQKNIKRIADLQKYTLQQIHSHYLGHEYMPLYDGNHKDCALALEAVLKKILHWVPSLCYALEKATPKLHHLQPLLATLTQILDVSVSFSDEETSVSSIEIHLSPYNDTIRKALITGLDILRLRRLCCDVKQVTAFAFPKLFSPQCVAKIDICFKNFTFLCHVEELELDEIGVEVPRSFRSFTRLQNNQPLCDREFLIRLTKEELDCFPGAGYNEQLPARGSIIVRNDEWVYKINFWHGDQAALEIAALRIRVENYSIKRGSTLRSAIHLTQVTVAGAEFYKYPHIKHDPLTRAEAKRCLMALYRGLHNALDEVHSKLGLAHMDVRLDNMF